MTIDPRAIPDMLHWYDGMLLLPEHFQAASRRQEMLSGYLAQVAVPHGWGVRRLEAEVRDGTLRVLVLEAVMPDGLMVDYRATDGDARPLEIELTSKQQRLEARHKLLVHVVVVAWSDGEIAQEGIEAGGLARYRSVRGARLERDDPDAATGTDASEMMRERPWLRPILKLHVGNGGMTTPPAKYVGLPIARVMQNAEAAIVLDPRYEPPRTEIGASGQLFDTAQTVARELRNKAQFLSERLQNEQRVPDRQGQATAQSIDMQLQLLNRRFQMLQRNVENLQALSRTVPRLEGLTQDGHAHPFALYLTLCDIVGDLAMLGGELNLPKVPAYEHRDPLASLDILERHIFRMLESLNQKFRVIEFIKHDDHQFELAINREDLGKRFVVGAVRAKGEPASSTATWMQHATIATSEKLADLKRRRVNGPGRTAIDRDEALDLAAPTLTSLFRIEVDPDHFDAADPKLVIRNADADGPMSILLYLPRDPQDTDPVAAAA